MFKSAILICVYKNDNLSSFKCAINSVLDAKWEISDFTILLYVDGSICNDIRKYVSKFLTVKFIMVLIIEVFLLV